MSVSRVSEQMDMNSLRSGRSSKVPLQRKKSLRQPGQEKKIGEDEFMAAAIGDVEWLKQSIRGNRGAINFDKNGLTPLHLAAIHGRLECMKVLLEKFKYDIDLPSKTGWRAAHLVISNQTGKRAFYCLIYLLEHGADASITNEDSLTPMHQAASEGHVQCLKALIEGGARVDLVDYRGHTPLDLAKLWGHRKCARILAAELWHQDKYFLANEMKQLQKIKMQKVLEEIEADEENKAHQEFYGDLAFKEWLRTKELKPKPTGPRDELQETKTAPSIRTAPKSETLHKANSIQPHARTPLSPSPPSMSPCSPLQQSRGSRRSPTSVYSSRNSRLEPIQRDSGDTYPSTTQAPHTTAPETAPEPPKPDTRLEHESLWNKSTKIPMKDYPAMLDDHYPRDEYSMMPKYSPKRQTATPSSPEQGQPIPAPESVQMPTDPPADSVVVYKCKHIADIHKKRHVPRDKLPRHEAGIHLGNDPTSELFQGALLNRQMNFWRAESFNLTACMQLMEKVNEKLRTSPTSTYVEDREAELISAPR